MADLKKVSCPSCHQKYRLPGSADAKKVVCRSCKMTFTVEGNSSSPSNGSAESESSIDGGMFDSLDIDSMLNAESSGLKRTIPSQQIRQRKQPTAKQPLPQPEKIQTVNPVAEPEQQAVLPITVPKRPKKSKTRKEKKREKKTDGKSRTEQTHQPTESETQTKPKASEQPIDPEEAALFEYARRDNQRKNTIAIVFGLLVALGLGGFFFVKELEHIRKPLTAEEREALEAQGFRLEASKVAGGKFKKLANGVERVEVVPGVRPVNLGKAREGDGRKKFDAEKPFDPNREFAGGAGNNRRDRANRGNIANKKKVPIDYDTSADLVERDPTSSFNIKIRQPSQSIATISPRGHVYFRDGMAIRAYDLATQSSIGQRTVHTSKKLSSLAVTPDNRWLVAGFGNGALTMFQIDKEGRFYQTRRLLQTLFTAVEHLAISADSKQFAAADISGGVSVWDIDQNKQIYLHRSEPNIGQLNDIVWIAPTKLLAAYDQADITIDLKDRFSKTRKVANARPGVQLSSAASVATFISNDHVVANRLNRDEVLWKKTIRPSASASLTVSNDGQTGFFDEGGKAVFQIELESGSVIQRLPVNRISSKSKNSTVLSPDSKFLLRANGNRQWEVIELFKGGVESLVLASPEPPLPLPKPTYPDSKALMPNSEFRKSVSFQGETVTALRLANRGLLVAATQSGQLSVHDWTRSITLQEILFEDKLRVTALAFCDQRLLVGHRSGQVSVYNVSDVGRLSLFDRFKAHDSSVFAIECLAQDNRKPNSVAQFVSVSDRGNVKVRQLNEKTFSYDQTPFEDSPQELVVTPDGKIQVASNSKLATINSVTSKTDVMGSQRGGLKIALSADGKRLAFLNHLKISIAKTSSGTISKTFELKEAPTGLQFDPSGRSLFVFYPSRTELVRVSNGKVWKTLDVDIDSSSHPAVAISEDGKLMASFSKSAGKIFISLTPME